MNIFPQQPQVPMPLFKTSSKHPNIMYDILNSLHTQIQSVNQSKLFAGLIIITLNIASKFVNIKLSKTMESYLKNTFSHQLLVFAMAWMGTRDIYIAFFISVVFILCITYFFNEESCLYCLPESFKNHHLSLFEEKNVFSNVEIKKNQDVLDKAKDILESLKQLPADRNTSSSARANGGGEGGSGDGEEDIKTNYNQPSLPPPPPLHRFMSPPQQQPIGLYGNDINNVYNNGTNVYSR